MLVAADTPAAEVQAAAGTPAEVRAEAGMQAVVQAVADTPAAEVRAAVDMQVVEPVPEQADTPAGGQAQVLQQAAVDTPAVVQAEELEQVVLQGQEYPNPKIQERPNRH